MNKFLLVIGLAAAQPVADRNEPLKFKSLELADAPWGCAVTELHIPKGFKFRHCERLNAVAWQGQVQGHNTVVTCSFTPLSKKLWEISLIVGDEVELPKAKQTYLSMKSTLVSNYGRPNNSYEFCSGPYYIGDGHETEALQTGNYNLSDFWMRLPKARIGMAVTPEGWTCITFESKVFRSLEKQETLNQ